MANTKSAKKRARQSEKRRLHNVAIRSDIRSSIRNAKAAIVAGSSSVEDLVREAMSAISKGGKRGTVHRRNAARKISRLMKYARKTLQAQSVAPAASTAAAKKKSPAKKTASKRS